MVSNLDGYTDEGKREIIRAIIEQKHPMREDDPEYSRYKKDMVSMLSEFISDPGIIDQFVLFDYAEDEYIFSEEYTGGKAYFLLIIDGLAACTLQKNFISYKARGDMLGTIGMAYEEKLGSPHASIISISKHVIAARLHVTEEIRKELRSDVLFMRKIAADLADMVRENNVYYILKNSRSKMLSAYIKVTMTENENHEYVWAPKKSEVVKELSLFDNSQLNAVIDALCKKNILTVNSQKKTKANSYFVDRALLDEELKGIDTTMISRKFRRG